MESETVAVYKILVMGWSAKECKRVAGGIRHQLETHDPRTKVLAVTFDKFHEKTIVDRDVQVVFVETPEHPIGEKDFELFGRFVRLSTPAVLYTNVSPPCLSYGVHRSFRPDLVISTLSEVTYLADRLRDKILLDVSRTSDHNEAVRYMKERTKDRQWRYAAVNCSGGKFRVAAKGENPITTFRKAKKKFPAGYIIVVEIDEVTR